MVVDKTAFLATLRNWEIFLEEGQIANLSTLGVLLYEENKVQNLTRIPPEQFFTHHLLDSLSLVPYIKKGAAPLRFADLGSGAGFPALPLAVVFPQSSIFAIDSERRKLDFIAKVSEILNLPNIKVIHGRLEHLGNLTEYREQFDLVTSRALAPFPDVLELALPFVKIGGSAYFYTSKVPEEGSLGASAIFSGLGAGTSSVSEVAIPGIEGNRYIVAVSKVRPTTVGLPRPNWAKLKKRASKKSFLAKS